MASCYISVAGGKWDKLEGLQKVRAHQVRSSFFISSRKHIYGLITKQLFFSSWNSIFKAFQLSAVTAEDSTINCEMKGAKGLLRLTAFLNLDFIFIFSKFLLRTDRIYYTHTCKIFFPMRYNWHNIVSMSFSSKSVSFSAYRVL